MKRKALLLLPLAFMVTSCGTNTQGWPTIDLPFSVDKVYSVTMNYVEKQKDDRIFSDMIVISESNRLLKFYNEIDLQLIKEKPEKTLETKKYWVKIIFDFKLINYESSFYRLVYYGYGLFEGKIMLDNGEVHWVPGVFPQIYEKFAN